MCSNSPRHMRICKPAPPPSCFVVIVTNQGERSNNMPGRASATGKRKNTDRPQQADEKLSKVDISTSDPRTIVLMLDSSEVNVISKACEALLRHVENSEQNILEIVELGGIPKMIKLISSPDRVPRCHAMLCLCAMAPCAPVRRLIYKSDCIPALLKLLSPDEELLTQERASYILTLLAADYSFKVALGEHNTHKPLLALTQSSDPDTQKNSVKVLCQLMENFQLRPALLNDDGLPAIIKLLDSEYAIIQELALQTLRSCVHHGPSRQVVADGEGLKKLVALLGDKDCADVHVLGVEVLGICLGDTNSMSVLQGSGCLHQLISNITESSNQQMKKHATSTLASAASNALNRKILHENQIEKTFIQLLAKEEGVVAESACCLLANMADLNSSRQLIGQEGGVVELVKHLKGISSVRAAAVHCLACLLHESPANCKLFAENHGLEALTPLFSDSQAVCRHYAAECVVSISCEEAIRQAVIAGGAVGNMVGSLSFQDSTVQASTAHAIGMLACDQTARQQVCSSGGLEPLLQLLRSSHQEVVKNAMWMLMVCAQCPQVAEEACRLGAIELMEKVADSGESECVAMATSSLERLFRANLPAKYWVTGALDMTDSTVGTEFFDAGPAFSKNSFTPLSKLFQQPLNKSQPIITANLLATPTTGTAPTSGTNEDGAPSALEDGQSNTNIGQSNTNLTSSGRKGSRLHTSKSKRRTERESESRISQEEGIASEEPSKSKLPGLLDLDQGLWDHIQHVTTNIKPLPSITQQLQELAKYVASQMGGPVERSGPLCFELPTGHKQIEQQSNLVPLGQIHQGSFQHRALLFKVLCDHLGLPCSLIRGEYSRHWNEVSLQETTPPSSPSVPQDGHKRFLVDLMFNPGKLLPANMSQAVQYQHIV